MKKKEIVAALRRSMDRTTACFEWDGPTLDRSYGKGKWSGRQILAHLADCELHFLLRLRFILAEENPPIVPFEQDDWAARFDYAKLDSERVRDNYRVLRQGLIETVAAASEKDLDRAGRHPERPDYTARYVAEHAAEHNDHHLGQLEAIRAGRRWKPIP
jgi:uncharacterized damage-inducible protein DinB